jgi:hypothetical protein
MYGSLHCATNKDALHIEVTKNKKRRMQRMKEREV